MDASKPSAIFPQSSLVIELSTVMHLEQLSDTTTVSSGFSVHKVHYHVEKSKFGCPLHVARSHIAQLLKDLAPTDIVQVTVTNLGCKPKSPPYVQVRDYLWHPEQCTLPLQQTIIIAVKQPCLSTE
jgi:translation initiation factor 2B subunit (eIF-2B alpha/beta/delta family)